MTSLLTTSSSQTTTQSQPGLVQLTTEKFENGEVRNRNEGSGLGWQNHCCFAHFYFI